MAKQVETVAVAIDKDKGSQHALKWAVDHLLSRTQVLTLLHVKHKISSVPTQYSEDAFAVSKVLNDEITGTEHKQQLDHEARELFLPFRCFCTRKDIKCNEVILEDMDIARALINYVSSHTIKTLVLGASSRTSFIRRFKTADVPSSVSKGAPDYCTVYVITKGKITSQLSATIEATSRIHLQADTRHIADPIESPVMPNQRSRGNLTAVHEWTAPRDEDMEIKSPFTRGKASMARCESSSLPEIDISFVSGRGSSANGIFSSLYDSTEYGRPLPLSSCNSDEMSMDMSSLQNECLSNSRETRRMTMSSWSSQSQSMARPREYISTEINNKDVRADEIRRLRLELRQTMDMYIVAHNEALTSKQKAREVQLWKIEEERRLEGAQVAEEAALAFAEKERTKCKAAIESAEAAQRIALVEAKKRMNTEMKTRIEHEEEERKSSMNALATGDIRYRKYTIEEIKEATEYFSKSKMIGEGGYGPVYKGYLDHTPVAIKVLRPDHATQGRSQFLQEVEVLCNIRHPNMVLLLGACPEYGCLVYECMANGSLEDRLFRRGGTPVLSWQLRFQIAAEVATGLHFLHQTKPEPLVHRDLKPGNILLDRNYVSKISDVGLARLVPPSIADSATQYLMTSTAGTFCYIDPEYQQTGLLGTKSDIYSLGILFLQIITAKPPMGLARQVEDAIENGTLGEILDPAVLDWPIEEALNFARLALQCAELRRKDRPDLGNVVLPELERLRALAEETMPIINLASVAGSSFGRSQDLISDSQSLHSGYASSSRSRSSTSSFVGRRYYQVVE